MFKTFDVDSSAGGFSVPTLIVEANFVSFLRKISDKRGISSGVIPYPMDKNDPPPDGIGRPLLVVKRKTVFDFKFSDPDIHRFQNSSKISFCRRVKFFGVLTMIRIICSPRLPL